MIAVKIGGLMLKPTESQIKKGCKVYLNSLDVEKIKEIKASFTMRLFEEGMVLGIALLFLSYGLIVMAGAAGVVGTLCLLFMIIFGVIGFGGKAKAFKRTIPGLFYILDVRNDYKLKEIIEDLIIKCGKEKAFEFLVNEIISLNEEMNVKLIDIVSKQ